MAVTQPPKHQQSLASLLHYFIGMELTVELKTGRMLQGRLSSSDDAMNVTLEDVMTSSAVRRATTTQHIRRRPEDASGSSSSDTNTNTNTNNQLLNLLSMVHIRGSTIRYIHFPDDADLTVTIKQGMDRERSAAQKYQRGVRKAKK
jgi:small nuclear ribonucleoprotein (snRNP)-like protein